MNCGRAIDVRSHVSVSLCSGSGPRSSGPGGLRTERVSRYRHLLRVVLRDSGLDGGEHVCGRSVQFNATPHHTPPHATRVSIRAAWAKLREDRPRLRAGEAAVDANAAADAREQFRVQALPDDIYVLEEREAARAGRHLPPS